jgi:hypothetical protein
VDLGAGNPYGNRAVNVRVSPPPVLAFLATGASVAGAGFGGPFPFLLAMGASVAGTGFGGPFPFLFLSLEEDGGFLLTDAVVGASMGFSSTDIGATTATSAMDAGGAAIAESGDPDGSKFRDTEEDGGGGG